MKIRSFTEIFKNAIGTVFLLASAFFVCSTLVSMRQVLADPIAPAQFMQNTAVPQAGRAGAQSPRATRAGVSASTVARTAAGTASRAVAARSTASRAAAGTSPAARTVSARRTVANAAPTASQARSVRARVGMQANATAGAAGTASRVSLQGPAMRATTGTSLSYLQSKLYTGNYSNIIDQTTGLISAEAYSNCLDSYYTCMDEICTARNQAQRRCACAGRVRAFSEAERNLEAANEELIKVSGELALLISTGGKDISAAFQLTDAEKVLNCVSWKDNNERFKVLTGTAKTDAQREWCQGHMIYDESCWTGSQITMPSYCNSTNNNFGFNIDDLTGSGSDILASLKSWADAKAKTQTITENNSDSLLYGFNTVMGAVNQMSGVTGLSLDESVKDSLAETWGYDLFVYAHNNVCNRVLDSCFNGIFEACGAPGTGGRKCTTGTSCPYNFNSYIKVDNTGGANLEFITGSSNQNSNASCFGYATVADTAALRGVYGQNYSADPYKDLRGPVADARRSVLQKYALDANADCDLYGEQLRTAAQNIGYQKVAAQQALQQKRLEFARADEAAVTNRIRGAQQSFMTCLDRIQSCYTQISQQYAGQGWTTNRIRTHCSTMSEVPECYNEMVCDRNATLVVTELDATNTGAVQNVVTLAEILGFGGDDARALCLNNDLNVREIRNFGSMDNLSEACIPTNGTSGTRTWNSTLNGWNECNATACRPGYVIKHETINNAGINVCRMPANSMYDAIASAAGQFVVVPYARCNPGYMVSNDSAKCGAEGTPCCAPYTCPAGATHDASCGSSGDSKCAPPACRCAGETVWNGTACTAP